MDNDRRSFKKMMVKRNIELNVQALRCARVPGGARNDARALGKGKGGG